MQRVIGIVTFLIIVAGSYYWLVIDQERTNTMASLHENDTELSGDVNSTIEVYNRLEKKWIGTSKHVQTLQLETQAHYKAYAEKMDSINLVFEEIKFSIDQLEEVLISKIDRVKDDVRNVSDAFDSYKRKTDRDLRNIKNDISTMRDDFENLKLKVETEHPEKKK
jgi:hypothetical protein